MKYNQYCSAIISKLNKWRNNDEIWEVIELFHKQIQRFSTKEKIEYITELRFQMNLDVQQGGLNIYGNTPEFGGVFKEEINRIELTLKSGTSIESTEKQIPKELDSTKAKLFFEKAISLNLMTVDGNGYKWLKTKQLLAYFAMMLSSHLNLSTKLDKEGNITINWILFEHAFGTSKLKGAKHDWLKYNTKFTPNGFEKVDEVFK
jgi:hypothetical protein